MNIIKKLGTMLIIINTNSKINFYKWSAIFGQKYYVSLPSIYAQLYIITSIKQTRGGKGLNYLSRIYSLI